MYRLVPGRLHDAGPNPQPALPQRLHFSSSSSSLLRTYCFWPRLRCTELGCILLSSFSPGDSLNQSPGARYSVARPPPFGGPWLCVHPPHDGVALLAALLRKMRLLDLLSASRESHANISSESPCLGAGLPLFTELPRRVLLGNSAYLTREEGCSAVVKARRESGSTTKTMIRTATTSDIAIKAFSAAPGAMTSPGAPKRKLSTQTTMVTQ